MKTEEKKATLKVERTENVQLSEFEKAQAAIINVGHKIRRHANLSTQVNELTSFEVVQEPNHYQGICVTDSKNHEFTITEPILVGQIIQHLLERCKSQMNQLEAEIVSESKNIAVAKAA